MPVWGCLCVCVVLCRLYLLLCCMSVFMRALCMCPFLLTCVPASAWETYTHLVNECNWKHMHNCTTVLVTTVFFSNCFAFQQQFLNCFSAALAFQQGLQEASMLAKVQRWSVKRQGLSLVMCFSQSNQFCIFLAEKQGLLKSIQVLANAEKYWAHAEKHWYLAHVTCRLVAGGWEPGFVLLSEGQVP